MTPKLIDIHCHVDFPDFDQDRGEVIKNTLDSGMWFINVGENIETSNSSIELASQNDGVFATVGIHPHNAGRFCVDVLQELATKSKVVAIGECGMDTVRSKTFKNEQEETFVKQVKLAQELDKPLMIHCREAHDEVLDILKSFPDVRANIHFFSGSWRQAKKYLDLGCSLSFTGVITFARQYDEIIEKIPMDRLMVETDAPFVAPVPYRGQRCEPLYVEKVVKRIAQIRKMSFDEVAERTTQNAIKFFGLK